MISGFSSASITKNAKKSNKEAGDAQDHDRRRSKTTSSTTYTEKQAAASTNLAVGDCVTAAGSSDSTGAVSATTVRITSTGGQTCTTGFGERGLLVADAIRSWPPPATVDVSASARSSWPESSPA